MSITIDKHFLGSHNDSYQNRAHNSVGEELRNEILIFADPLVVHGHRRGELGLVEGPAQLATDDRPLIGRQRRRAALAGSVEPHPRIIPKRFFVSGKLFRNDNFAIARSENSFCGNFFWQKTVSPFFDLSRIQIVLGWVVAPVARHVEQEQLVEPGQRQEEEERTQDKVKQTFLIKTLSVDFFY